MGGAVRDGVSGFFGAIGDGVSGFFGAVGVPLGTGFSGFFLGAVRDGLFLVLHYLLQFWKFPSNG